MRLIPAIFKGLCLGLFSLATGFVLLVGLLDAWNLAIDGPYKALTGVRTVLIEVGAYDEVPIKLPSVIKYEYHDEQTRIAGRR